MLLYEFEPTSPGGTVVAPIQATAAGVSLDVALYGAAAVAFTLLAVVLVIKARRNLSAGAFTVAVLLTAGWLAVATYQYWDTGRLQESSFALDMVSALGWVSFVVALLWSIPHRLVHRHLLAFAAAVSVVVVGGLAVGFGYLWLDADLADTPFMAARLVLIILTAVLLENLVRNTRTDHWWSFKFLCLGLGGMLIYDLFLYADGLLFTALNKSLVTARGGVYALIAPLLFIAAVRRDMWQEQIVLSHKSAFFSTAMVAIGGYLAVMALAAFYIQELGGSWGPVAQVVFLFGAMVTGLVVAFSGTSRAFLRVAIAKHFFRYKYDYREEWLRFTRILSGTENGAPVPPRVVDAIAEVVDSTGGALWAREGGRHSLAAAVNCSAQSLGNGAATSLETFLRRTGWVIVLDEVHAHPERYQGLEVPQALMEVNRAWIIVPLIHRSEVSGFVLLLQPRAPRSLIWEDFDLLKLIGGHAASFLAEHRASQALIEAQQFDRFNRRTAFVIHDIKNIVSQLSLFAGNIQNHGDNPAFREDLAVAVDDAVGRMKRLVDHLRVEPERKNIAQLLNVTSCLTRILKTRSTEAIVLHQDGDSGNLEVFADVDRLRAVFDHLLQNALDVSPAGKPVRIVLGRSSGQAVIEIADQGPGMDPEFVSNQLFAPFRSTKKSGLGIGAFQCRDYVRELGGDIEVVSCLGAGTTMRIFIPLASNPVVQTTESAAQVE